MAVLSFLGELRPEVESLDKVGPFVRLKAGATLSRLTMNSELVEPHLEQDLEAINLSTS